MSGETILIEQLRAEVERLRDDLSATEARLEVSYDAYERDCRDLRGKMTRAQTDRDHARLDRDSAIARAEKAERFIATADSEWKARAEKAERERDEARSERDARPDISAEDARAFMMFKPVPARDSREGPVMHALRAHAAKAVNP